MEREIDVVKKVADYLIQHGYPEESLILEWKISDRQRVDLAVIDIVSKKPVALFEFKRQRRQESENMAISQLKRFSETLDDTTIPLYVVFGADNELGFEILFLTEEDGNQVLKPVQILPLFSVLKNSYLSKAVTKNEKDKKNTFNWFKFICWLLAILLSLLLYLDFRDVINITAERLGIMAIIIGLIVIPFARKLNILGLEFERLQE